MLTHQTILRIAEYKLGVVLLPMARASADVAVKLADALAQKYVFRSSVVASMCAPLTQPHYFLILKPRM